MIFEVELVFSVCRNHRLVVDEESRLEWVERNRQYLPISVLDAYGLVFFLGIQHLMADKVDLIFQHNI